MITEQKLTFSKMILACVMVLYILGALLGVALVIISAVNDIHLGNAVDSGMFIALATYIGTPTATAIGFYSWKAKSENLLKIQYGNAGNAGNAGNTCKEPIDISTLANMGG